MTVTVIPSNGTGRIAQFSIDDDTTLTELIAAQALLSPEEDVTIRVLRGGACVHDSTQNGPNEVALKDGDRVSISPNKQDGNRL